MLPHVVKAVVPIGVGFFVRIEDVLRIHNVFGLPEISQHLFAVHLASATGRAPGRHCARRETSRRTLRTKLVDCFHGRQ